MIVESGQLHGPFKGFHNRETIFQFHGGGVWRQCVYDYQYYYAYMPFAKVVARDGSYFIEVEGMETSVEVVQIR